LLKRKANLFLSKVQNYLTNLKEAWLKYMRPTNTSLNSMQSSIMHCTITAPLQSQTGIYRHMR